jgi:hypothetical protein
MNLLERLTQVTPNQLETRPNKAPELGFLTEVLPSMGNYALWTKGDKQHYWFESVADLMAGVNARLDQQGVYFATAAFNEIAVANGNKGARTQANIAFLKALRLDLDAGIKKLEKHGPGAVYVTQQDALDSLESAVQAGLPAPSLVVSSGEGLHVYWVLDADAKPGEWQPVAESLSKAAEHLGIKQDYSVTTDSARILRPVGTLHENGQRVRVLKRTGNAYALRNLGERLNLLAPLDSVPNFPNRLFDTSVNADMREPKREDKRDRDPGLISKECPMLRDFLAGKVTSEPEWRGVAGVLKYCTGGEQLWHDGSAHDPRYDRREAQSKWDGWTAPPTKCGAAPQCGNCKHRGSITSPVQLGDVATDAPLKANPDNAQALQEALTAGGLQAIMDTDGQLNFVMVTTDDIRTVRTCLYADSEAATDALIAMAAMGGEVTQRQSNRNH